MEVKVKQYNRNVFFNTVEPGQVFTHEELVYMRLCDEYAVHDSYGDYVNDFNAVLLSHGELFHFSYDDVVQLPIKVTPMEVIF